MMKNKLNDGRRPSVQIGGGPRPIDSRRRKNKIIRCMEIIIACGIVLVILCAALDL